MVSSPPMAHNFGTQPIMRAGGKDESLIRFDLGSIPSSSIVDRATLQLYVAAVDLDAGGSVPVNVHRAITSWDETIVTFRSFAQHFDSTVIGSIVTTTSSVQKSVELTQTVKSFVSGTVPNEGFLLESASTDKAIFVTREGGTDEQKPTLEVCYRIVVDECSPNPCQNHGTCENGASGYTCQCAPGYTGANCELPVDNCEPAPCKNGATCTNGVNTYACTCQPGFIGGNCEIDSDDCSPNPCQNAGVCQDGIASHTCFCEPGYAGGDCETLIDNCASAPCQNDANCVNGVNSYTCMCASGFTGSNCEINIDDCSPNACLNGGSCIDGISGYACSCPPDWGGTTCNVDMSACSQHPCLNGGACSNTVGSYTCTCPLGFSGNNCEIDVNECANQPCQNGGSCIDLVGAYTCQCHWGYSGANCDVLPTGVDLALSFDGPTQAMAGSSITVKINVVNHGPNEATGTEIRIVQPAGFGVVGSSLQTTGGSFRRVTENGVSVWYNDYGSLGSGATATITMGGIPDPTLPCVFSASVTTTAGDRDATSNAASHTVSIVPASTDLFGQFFVSPSSPKQVGTMFTYTAQVYYSGDPAPGFTITDDLPLGLTLYSACPSASQVFGTPTSCSGGSMTCTWSTQPDGHTRVVCTQRYSGGTRQANIVVIPQAPGTYTNSFTLTGTGLDDPNPSNNTASVEVTVN